MKFCIYPFFLICFLSLKRVNRVDYWLLQQKLIWTNYNNYITFIIVVVIMIPRPELSRCNRFADFPAMLFSNVSLWVNNGISQQTHRHLDFYHRSSSLLICTSIFCTFIKHYLYLLLTLYTRSSSYNWIARMILNY